MLVYIFLDTDGSPSALPLVEVTSGLLRRMTSCRAGDSARMFEKLQKLAKGEKRQNKYSWRARRHETIEARRSSSGSRRVRGVYTLKKLNASNFGGRTLNVKGQKKKYL